MKPRNPPRKLQIKLMLLRLHQHLLLHQHRLLHQHQLLHPLQLPHLHPHQPLHPPLHLPQLQPEQKKIDNGQQRIIYSRVEWCSRIAVLTLTIRPGTVYTAPALIMIGK